MESQKLSKGGKVGIGVLIAALVAVVLAILFWPRSSKADTKPGPGPTPDPGPTPGPDDPTPAPAPDPMKATAGYIKGQYHIVKTNDSDVRICQLAGFTPAQVSQARKVLRDHARNGWIPQKVDDPATSYDERSLNLFQGWAPMVGMESLTWAWQTERVTYGGRKWPIVYIPLDSEVGL